ncbi:MAG: DNA-binding transcriptional regulator LsrR, DeoR family [Nocardioides sp.]|uniref:sugar-binding transcriptional regulator n=1 Tax=Nocardioides sp. TaxID=35761 RepID=UPI0026150BC2|nr:sugar-binding domain-containing protein [Nocardioides sp.]MCW2835628.1 DNA-binding transcriptional regulator LsrR, DeoR family [Nocardioides sp.]
MNETELGPTSDVLRLTAVVARLYHVHGVRQREIGARLGMSQARVSRLLRQAEDLGIIRTVVAVPDGLRPELEEAIERQFGLVEVHVVPVTAPSPDLASVLGQAAARQLDDALVSAETVGFTSWSLTLQAMAFALPAVPRTATRHVVEMLGDLGSPARQHSAARSTQSLATALGAEPVFLRTPGVLTTSELRDAMLRNEHVQRALGLLDDLDMAFVGVGPPAVHSQLQTGDNYFSPDQLAEVRGAGAVSQLNQRFLDEAGSPVPTSLDDLVVGCTLEQLAAARRRVVVAGGADKHLPIVAALRGGWVDVLVTDLDTARLLVG